MKEISTKMTMRYFPLVKLEKMKISIPVHIDKYVEKQSLSHTGRGRRCKLVQLLLEDNLILAVVISKCLHLLIQNFPCSICILQKHSPICTKTHVQGYVQHYLFIKKIKSQVMDHQGGLAKYILV